MESLIAVVLALLLQHPEATRPCDDVAHCAGLAIDIGLAVHDAHVLTGIEEEYLLAFAWLESGLDRTRHGRKGQGVVGINAESPLYAYAVMECDAHPEEDCVAVQLRFGAAYFQYERGRRPCGLSGAIRSYGTGKCKPTEGGDKYLSRWRRALRHVRKIGGDR